MGLLWAEVQDRELQRLREKLETQPYLVGQTPFKEERKQGWQKAKEKKLSSLKEGISKMEDSANRRSLEEPLI